MTDTTHELDQQIPENEIVCFAQSKKKTAVPVPSDPFLAPNFFS